MASERKEGTQGAGAGQEPHEHRGHHDPVLSQLVCGHMYTVYSNSVRTRERIQQQGSSNLCHSKGTVD